MEDLRWYACNAGVNLCACKFFRWLAVQLDKVPVFTPFISGMKAFPLSVVSWLLLGGALVRS